MWLKLSTLTQMVLFIIHKEYKALTYGFIIRSAVAVTCRSGSVLLSAAILLGNPWDRQSTTTQKGFPLPSGLLNLVPIALLSGGRYKLSGDQRNLREQFLNFSSLLNGINKSSGAMRIILNQNLSF